MTDRWEIALTKDEFTGRIPIGGSVSDYENDYALTRLVARNCSVDLGEPRFAVKGGFAVRRLFAGPRYSRDADISPAGTDLGLDRPPTETLLLPSDMSIAQEVPQDSLRGFRAFIQYRSLITPRKVGRAQCDINDESRVLRDRPPRKRLLTSPFLGEFEVWAAATEEIVAEKLHAFGRYQSKVKHVFDARHVLMAVEATPEKEPFDPGLMIRIYTELRSLEGGSPLYSALRATIADLSSERTKEVVWRADVLNFVPDAPSWLDACADLCGLLDRVAPA